MRIQSTSFSVRHAVVVGTVLAASTLLAGVAQAEGVLRVPGADGVIHSCYNADGRLRLIDPAVESCRREEAPLQWNQTGAQGPQGRQGPQGPQGPAAAPGISGYQRVVESIPNFTLAPGTESVHVETCPDGKKVVGGGWASFNAGGFLSENTGGPVSDTEWAVSVYNPTPNAVTIGTEDFYAICVNVS